jgi:hypothetical protein
MMGINDIKEMGIINWRQAVQDRDGCRRATRKVLILLG